MSKAPTHPPISFAEAIERYKPLLSPCGYAQLLEISAASADISVRANLLKNKEPLKALRRWEADYGWKTTPVAFCENALQVQAYDTYPSKTLEHRLGYFYMQDAASMLPVALFSPPGPDDLILDMAASPGGKTTQLVDSGMDQSFILANDSSASRLQALKVVLQTWSALNTAITNYAGEKLGDWFPNTFARVLLDAPCSMESLRSSPSHPHRPISISERERLAARQTALLESACKACAVGGEIVYSTCTMAPEEDEAVVDAILKAYPSQIAVDALVSQSYEAPGLTQFEGADYHPDLVHSLRVWPHLFGTNGFFAVKLMKLAPTPSSAIEHPSRPFKMTDLNPLTRQEESQIIDHIQALYGLDLEKLLEKFQLVPLIRQQNVFLIPLKFTQRFADLPYYALGTPIGKFISTRFEVSVEFVNRFGDDFTRGFWQIPEEHLQEWMRGADLRNIALPGLAPGEILAVRDSLGRNLGAGKNNPGRLRNLLPKRNLNMF